MDYNDGLVLPMAIERHVVIAAALATTRRADDTTAPHLSRLCSIGQTEIVSIDTTSRLSPAPPVWANYVRGVIAGFQDRRIALPAFDLAIGADLPMGGGLSSSAALEVAAATLLEALTQTTLSPVEKALLCQRAEHEFAFVPCGIMDQFASTMGQQGHLLLIDCRSQNVEPVAMKDENVSVLIVNSNVKHALNDGEYARRRQQCDEAAKALGVASLRDATMAMLERESAKMSPLVHRRARHVITEIERTAATAQAIRASDWVSVGQHMYESHASLRDDFEVSCNELDLLVEIARSIGEGSLDATLRGSVIGCRMTGGGFGGCVVCLVHSQHASAVAALMADRYHQETSIHASHFTTRPAQGARLLENVPACGTGRPLL